MLGRCCSFVARQHLLHFHRPPPHRPARTFADNKNDSPPSQLCVEHRFPSTCGLFPYEHPEPKTCFDLSKVLVEKGGECHEKIIRSFLFTHYWPREPSTVGLYMPICSPYLNILTEKYSTTGDRWLAFEMQPRTKERKPVGVIVADKTFPWVPDELEEWAHNCVLLPERHSMYFTAHCLRASDLFRVHHVPYIYHIDVLTTAAEVTGQGVASLLLRLAIMRAMEARHPLIMIISKSAYTHNICKRAGMKLAWAMNYSEFIDMNGKSVFYPRRPHHTVCVYIRKFCEKEGMVPDSCLSDSIYEIFRRDVIDKPELEPKPKKYCENEFPLFPRCQP